MPIALSFGKFLTIVFISLVDTFSKVPKVQLPICSESSLASTESFKQFSFAAKWFRHIFTMSSSVDKPSTVCDNFSLDLLMEFISPQKSLIYSLQYLCARASALSSSSRFLHPLSICLNRARDLRMCSAMGPSLGDPACRQPRKASRDAS